MSEAPKRPLQVEIHSSRHFADWIAREDASLALTTYQSGRLILLGEDGKGGVSGIERHFNRAMGLWCSSRRLYLATKFQLWQFDDVGAGSQGATYVPRVGWTTGDIDVHDVAVAGDGSLVFCATGLNCLATISWTHSCTPLWKPSFVSRVVLEDRCHLNGLAMRDGEPAFVTCVSESDVVDGWRTQRADGGVILDVASGEVVARGFSMPHSPRWHAGALWVLNSGQGEFCRIDVETGRLEVVAFLPGYLRGLAFHGGYAVVGLSKPRDRVFSGLALAGMLAEKHTAPRCGIAVVDLNSGAVVHTAWLEGAVTELYDVGVLPGVTRPHVLGFQSSEIETWISLDPAGIQDGSS